MADEPAPAPSNPPAEPTPNPPAPGAEPVKPVEPAEGKQVPYEVFKAKNDALRNAEEKLQAAEKAEAERLQAEQLAKGEHEKVIADLTPKAKAAEEYEALINKSVNAMMEEIPEEKRGLIHDALTPAQKFEYINANRAALMGEEKPKNVGKPSSPGTNGDEIGDSTIFTLEQISDPQFYQKNRDAILKAEREGRVQA